MCYLFCRKVEIGGSILTNEKTIKEKALDSKLLIIDDKYSNVLLLEKMLKAYGYKNIKNSTDSREASNLYRQYNPDLLILDLRMPHIDGFQILDELNAMVKDDYVPVVVITAENDEQFRLKALEMGAKDFIVKPFQQAEVLMRIKNLLHIRMLHNEVLHQNRILEDRVNQRTKELENMQIEFMQRLLRAAEFRDDDTGNHIYRIGKYANEMAKILELDKEFGDMLLHASMMHDIGKIGIPDYILLKPGKLNEEEWEKMKTHTIRGAEILANSSSKIVQLAEQIALTHHEKWDGSGYPKGLKEEEIPLSGRITAICDVFDALISKRPYKREWTKEEVIQEIKNGAGKHFDPFLVSIFLENIETFIKIKQDYS